MLSAYGVLVDIVHDICIYAWAIHSLPHLSLHPIDALISVMQVSRGAVKEFWVNAYLCPIEEQARLNGQFVPSVPEVLASVGNILPVFGHSSKGEVVDGAIHWFTFHGTSNDVQFSLRKLAMLDIVGYGDGEVVRL